MPDTQNVAHRLQEVLSTNITSIEIIPGDWTDWTSYASPEYIPSASFPFLLVEGNLGLPQKVIYRCYMASSTFSRGRSPLQTDHEEVDAILQKTACIVIANPAHQTALNSRKRLISNGEHAVDKELRFIGLLLRGVKACAKEGALWAHRRWCLNFISDAPFTSASARNEFATIKQAYTLYPRNYHAWTHWRYTFDACCTILVCADGKTTVREDLSKVILEEFRELRGWIDRHTTDTSAVHHLLTSLPTIQRLVSLGSFNADVSQKLEAESSPSELAKQAWNLLSSFLPPRETGYIYLQSLLPYVSPEERTLYVEDMARLNIPWGKIKYRARKL